MAGYDLPDGLLYIGGGLRATNGMVEPALIDPGLPVDRRRPDWAGRGLDYWPSYETIPAACRAAYLAWLADGRRDQSVPVGYVFLFFYGLERLVLVEAARDPSLRVYLPAVAAEVRRLLRIYRGNRSFASYGGEFLQLLELMAGPSGVLSPPERSEYRWQVPSGLRLGLAGFASRGEPVPAAWALSWAWHHPQIPARTPQTRCEREFHRLFQLRYAERHGAGLRVAKGRRQISSHYNPASAGIPSGSFPAADLPDVLEQAGPSHKLAELVAEVTAELDGYSRWLGRNPDGRGSVAAAALLPAALVDDASGEVGELRRWAHDQLGRADAVVIPGAELISRWPAASTDRMARPEAVACAQLLGSLGVGIEPDVRLGGPAIGHEPVVLYRDPAPSCAATAAYTAATVLLHLAVAVGAADGELSDAEQQLLMSHLESALHLTEPERRRLHAHLRWLRTIDVKLTGMKKRLAKLDATQRAVISDFLLAVAAADGVVSPAEVKVLTRIHATLGLGTDDLHDRLHRLLTAPRRVSSPPPATEPVVVRPGRAGSAGYAIPAPAHGTATTGLALDETAITEKLAQTMQVSALLSSIFVDDEPAAPAPPSAATPAVTSENATTTGLLPSTRVEPVAGLDAVHSALLRELATRETWTQAAYHELARCFGVMPAGATDALNEAAMDVSGEPVLEGDDDITINAYAMQELLA